MVARRPAPLDPSPPDLQHVGELDDHCARIDGTPPDAASAERRDRAYVREAPSRRSEAQPRPDGQDTRDVPIETRVSAFVRLCAGVSRARGTPARATGSDVPGLRSTGAVSGRRRCRHFADQRVGSICHRQLQAVTRNPLRCLIFGYRSEPRSPENTAMAALQCGRRGQLVSRVRIPLAPDRLNGSRRPTCGGPLDC